MQLGFEFLWTVEQRKIDGEIKLYYQFQLIRILSYVFDTPVPL
jgi:hypothetical protein